ncbi:hypothetical protein [Piscicoccus intestinalis]|uniref:hypothetical protein n=1 Tax=Piscicoccus intestinalis TaxID=746033 RepID=UPI0008387E47|nr:hypothetical protein [Piscicoccus intestinalis]
MRVVSRPGARTTFSDLLSVGRGSLIVSVQGDDYHRCSWPPVSSCPGVAVHTAFVAQWLVRHMVREGIPWTVFDPVLLFWPLWSLAAGLVVGLVLCHHGWLVATPSSTWVSELVATLPAIGLFVLGGKLACFYADAPRRWAAFIGLAAPVVIGLIVWWLGSLGKGPASRLWIEGAQRRRELVEEARKHRRGLEAEQARLTLAPSDVERRVGVLRRLLRRLT